MPILASNFTSNSLSGTTTVVAGNVTINLSSANFALEGDRTFVVKLRKVSSQGAVIATSPVVTIKDTTTFVSLTANTATVAEGNLVAFSLVTTNVLNGATVYYSVLPATANVTADDFVANTGSAVITNNAATFALQANADVSLSNEDGENFRVQLRTNSPAGNVVYATSNIEILDTYKTYNVLSFLGNSAASIPEGTNVTFTFSATNIPAGTILHYSTSGNTTNFSSNTGSFVMNGLSNTFVISNPQVPTNASRTYNAIVRAGSAQGAIVATSNTIVVLDGGLLYMSATGGTITDSGGFRVHQFTTSGNLVVTNAGANPTYSTINYLLVAGRGGQGPSTYGQGGGGGGGVLVGNVALSAGSLSVIIGAGGSNGSSSPGTNGANTTISSPAIGYAIYAVGGGGGGGGPFPSAMVGRSGGSGGGGGVGGSPTSGGTAFTPIITGATSYGNNGGSGSPNGFNGGGGGGAGGSGTPGYDGGPAPGNVDRGRGGYGFNAGPIGFDSGPWGAGAPGNGGISSDNQNDSIVLIKYPYVPPPIFTSIAYTFDFVKAGSNLTLTINTLNLANNTMLYYSTVGNVTASNFVSGNTGSFRSTTNATTLILPTNSLPANEERFFQLQVNPDGVGEAAAITSNVLYIRDSALVSLGGSGGTQSNIEGYRVHLFAAPQSGSTMTFSRPGSIEYLMAGGGGGAMSHGGGGAGGLLRGTTSVYSGNNYTITVGEGGYPTFSRKAGNTIAFGMTAYGGGSGSNNGANGGPGAAESGGSGAGGGRNGGNHYGGDGVPGQGNPGGFSGPDFTGGGGGGAESSGQGFVPNPGIAQGGHGIWSTITGSNVAYCGGGGGAPNSDSPAPLRKNGFGGGPTSYGGGTHGGDNSPGGPGVVIIRYPV